MTTDGVVRHFVKVHPDGSVELVCTTEPQISYLYVEFSEWAKWMIDKVGEKESAT